MEIFTKILSSKNLLERKKCCDDFPIITDSYDGDRKGYIQYKMFICYVCFSWIENWKLYWPKYHLTKRFENVKSKYPQAIREKKLIIDRMVVNNWWNGKLCMSKIWYVSTCIIKWVWLPLIEIKLKNTENVTIGRQKLMNWSFNGDW